MAFDKLGRFFGIAEDDEMNEAPYSEAEQQGEEVPQAHKACILSDKYCPSYVH